MIAQENAMDSIVEILARLYLEGNPAEISDATIADLCDWLMGEFHQRLPLNLQFSDYMRYENAAEMFVDIEKVISGYLLTATIPPCIPILSTVLSSRQCMTMTIT